MRHMEKLTKTPSIWCHHWTIIIPPTPAIKIFLFAKPRQGWAHLVTRLTLSDLTKGFSSRSWPSSPLSSSSSYLQYNITVMMINWMVFSDVFDHPLYTNQMSERPNQVGRHICQISPHHRLLNEVMEQTLLRAEILILAKSVRIMRGSYGGAGTQPWLGQNGSYNCIG